MYRTSYALTALLLAGCSQHGQMHIGELETVEEFIEATCPPADATHNALCVCEDFGDVGAVEVLDGPSGPGAVGVNGKTHLVSRVHATGDWIAYGGFESVSEVAIDGSLWSEGSASWVGEMTIGADLSVAGDLDGVGSISIAGELRVGGEEQIVGTSSIGARGPHAGLASPPCNCDPATLFDVADAVSAVVGAGNHSIDAVGAADLTLATGSYFFSDVSHVGELKLLIDGDVSLFVDGSLETVGSNQIELLPGSTLDLFVSGNVGTVGNVSVGGDADPTAFRLYIGGSDTAHLAVGGQVFYGSIYAPEAEVSYVGDTEIVGSLFARRLSSVGDLTVRYGAPAHDGCEEPTTPEEEPPVAQIVQ